MRPPITQSGRRVAGSASGGHLIRAHLKEIDNALGGGAVLPMTLAYLRQHVPVQMINAARCDLLSHLLRWVDPTLRHKNRVEVLIDGPEIVVRPVAKRRP